MEGLMASHPIHLGAFSPAAVAYPWKMQALLATFCVTRSARDEAVHLHSAPGCRRLTQSACCLAQDEHNLICRAGP